MMSTLPLLNYFYQHFDTSISITHLSFNSIQAKYIGKIDHYFEQIDSTNTYAMELIANSSPIEGTVISAGYQSAGRGQIGSEWEGEAMQNVYTSVILHPRMILAEQQFLLNQAVALGVSSALEEILETQVLLKWPNDLYVGKKKIGGILIQNVLSGKFLDYAVAGIGVNVNQDVFSAGIPNPVSMLIVSGEVHNTEDVKKMIYNHLEYWYEEMKAGNESLIQKTYHDALFRKDEVSFFKHNNAVFYGIIRGVDGHGRLVVQQDKHVRAYDLREIKMVIEML